MILNKTIYDRAVKLIDDPDINRAYVSDRIGFYKIMYPFLINGISIITAPTAVSALLAKQLAPEGITEVFDGDGSSEFSLTTTPKQGADMSFSIGSSKDPEAIYREDTNSVQFSRIVEEGESCSVEWYFGGCFSGDFATICGKFPIDALISRTLDLLARATVISWADKEKNFLLDIRNFLTDTDFKRGSNASALKSKIEWVKDLRSEHFNLQNKLDWDLRSQNRGGYGY